MLQRDHNASRQVADKGRQPIYWPERADWPARLAASMDDAIAALRRHPRFAEALERTAQMVMELYQGNRLVNVISNDRGRFILATLALSLHFSRNPDDPTSGLSATRLKEHCARLGVCSAGRAAAMIAMMRWAGYLEAAPPTADRRVRLLVPTENFLAMHRERWRRQLDVVRHLMPETEDAVARIDHPAFLPAYAVAQAEQFYGGFRFVDYAPEAAFFAERNAGLLILFSIVLAGAEDDDMPPTRPIAVSAAGLAKRFHVSRTHVITLLREAVDADLLERTGPDNQFRLLPCLREAIQNFMAAVYLFNAAAARSALAAVQKTQA